MSAEPWDSSCDLSRYFVVNDVAMADCPENVTQLLSLATDGDSRARDTLFRIVQDELHAIADRQMRTERSGNSLQATVLVDDAFLRLCGTGTEISFEDRKHFFRAAAKAMRQMLVDHQRKRQAQRRGGTDHVRVDLDPNLVNPGNANVDLLALDEALEKLAEIDQRQAQIVELHHFGGFSLKETAELVDVSMTTVKKDWGMAKAWLHRELTR